MLMIMLKMIGLQYTFHDVRHAIRILVTAKTYTILNPTYIRTRVGPIHLPAHPALLPI